MKIHYEIEIKHCTWRFEYRFRTKREAVRAIKALRTNEPYREFQLVRVTSRREVLIAP